MTLQEVLPASASLAVRVQPERLDLLIQTGEEPLGDGRCLSWTAVLAVNGQRLAQTSSPGRRLFLPIPAIRQGDEVLLSASRGADDETANHEWLEHRLTEAELRQILAVPLRVYAEAELDQTNAHCDLLPSVLDGELEWAFYLLVEGKKTQMRWYEPSPAHRFTLPPEQAGKAAQVRGFVRAVAAPDHKLSALSAQCRVTDAGSVTGSQKRD
ncbi:hypothetical protein CKO36_06235 [Rhabdochromatium marinum]|nr:hypothetical protein [Rhabdochromatium marinum]